MTPTDSFGNNTIQPPISMMLIARHSTLRSIDDSFRICPSQTLGQTWVCPSTDRFSLVLCFMRGFKSDFR